MLTLWLAAALAAEAAPPGNVTPDAAAAYEAASDALLDGPPGCWEVVGTVSYRWDAGRRGFATGDAAFVGRLVDGVWHGFATRSLGEDQQWKSDIVRHVFPHDQARFVPLVGRRKHTAIPGTYGGAGDNILHAALLRLGTDVDYAWSEWDAADEGVVLHRQIPFSEDSDAVEARMDVFFPQGDLLPVSVDVHFPERFTVPGKRFVHVKNAVAHIRGKVLGRRVFPEAETFSFDVDAFGFGGNGAQSIAYESFRPCGGKVEALDKAVGR